MTTQLIFMFKFSCGNDLKHLLKQKEMQQLMYGVESEVDQELNHGVLRKVKLKITCAFRHTNMNFTIFI